MHFKITFNLDGAGIVWRPDEPIHLDALIAWALAPMHCKKADLTREDEPEDIPLPLMKKQINGSWVWQASALFPEGETIESMSYIRKRFRESRVDLTTGSPNLTQGKYRGYNIPMPILCCTKMSAYASGNRKSVKKLLRQIKYLGQKRRSRIISIETEETEENYSLEMHGKVMRWLPDEAGTRLVRPRPPYWNNVGRVSCLEVGNDYR